MNRGNLHLKYHRYAGMRVNKNIYNRTGLLLIPAYTTLKSGEIERLRKMEIELNEEDVEPSPLARIVDAAMNELHDAFDIVRRSNRIPFDRVRERVIPIVDSISRHAELHGFWSHLERNDEYTYRHSIGVAALSRIIGRSMGIVGADLFELTAAGLLHDIGKAQVPLSIVNKPGKLSAEEFEQMKKHTEYGYELIRKSGLESSRYSLVALQHHEREDGSGYPAGLKGEQLDIFSKIVAVADVFHAMISKRVYKSPMPFYKVLQQMSQHAFGSLDPDTTIRFINKMMELTIGHQAVLSDGRQGKIIMVSAADPVHPLVEVNGQYIDLSKEHSIGIERIL